MSSVAATADEPGAPGYRITLGPLPTITLPTVRAVQTWRPPADVLRGLEGLLRRDEADVVLVVGNIALVAFEIIEWPVAALTLAVHALARSRFKGLEALAEVAEETE